MTRAARPWPDASPVFRSITGATMIFVNKFISAAELLLVTFYVSIEIMVYVPLGRGIQNAVANVNE